MPSQQLVDVLTQFAVLGAPFVLWRCKIAARLHAGWCAGYSAADAIQNKYGDRFGRESLMLARSAATCNLEPSSRSLPLSAPSISAVLLTSRLGPMTSALVQAVANAELHDPVVRHAARFVLQELHLQGSDNMDGAMGSSSSLDWNRIRDVVSCMKAANKADPEGLTPMVWDTIRNQVSQQAP